MLISFGTRAKFRSKVAVRETLMRLAIAIAEVLLVMLTACHHQRTSDLYEDPEAYAVYASILPSTEPLVLGPMTTTYELCLVPLDDQAETVLRPALDDWLKQNSTRWRLRENLAGTRQATVLSSHELEASFQHGTLGPDSKEGWAKFFHQHPTYPGWIEVSAVGFNHDKTIAVVYMAYTVGTSVRVASSERSKRRMENGNC